MRLLKVFLWFWLCGAVTFVSASAQAQTNARVAGAVVVAKVRGSVTAIPKQGAPRALADNDRIAQDYTVRTGAGASAILVFSNGATLNLGADSELAIEEFLQDPFADGVKLSDLKEEPSSSRTTLNLVRGELVGDVKHLHKDRGSEFNVKTPVGAAGIRGTTFRIVFRPDANGKVFFTLATAEGEVLFQSPAGVGVSVAQDKEVTVEVDATVDVTTGAITVNSTPTITSTTTISTESQTAIQTAVTEIVTQAATIIIDSTQAATEKAASEKALQTTNPTSNTQEQQTTSGDGKSA